MNTVSSGQPGKFQIKFFEFTALPLCSVVAGRRSAPGGKIPPTLKNLAGVKVLRGGKLFDGGNIFRGHKIIQKSSKIFW